MTVPVPAPDPEAKEPNGGTPRLSESTSNQDQAPPPVSPAIPPSILEKLPPEYRERFESVMLMGYGPLTNPLAAKVNEQHITKMIDVEARRNEAAAADRREQRRSNTLIYGMTLLFIAVLIIGLSALGDKDVITELVDKVFPYLVGGVLGALGGFGAGFHQGRKSAQEE